MYKLLFILVISFISTTVQAISDFEIKEIAQVVLDKLYDSKGDLLHLKAKPAIKISKNESVVAAYYHHKNTILLERKAYQVCQSLGADSLSALAIIIGHELAHVFDEENKHGAFAEQNTRCDFNENFSTQNEKTADIEGAFMAYLSGYAVKNVLPKLLDAIYEAYKLPDLIASNYPSRQERKNTAIELNSIVSNLIAIYEGSIYLMSLGEYTLAANSLEFIAKYYRGNEIYNSIGLAFSHEGMRYVNEGLDKFIYPFEIDWDTRIQELKSSDKSIVHKMREENLNKAYQYFSKAEKLNPNDDKIKINKICVLVLLEKFEEALESINELKQNSPEILLIKAIVLSRTDVGKSIDLFKSLENQEDEYWSKIAEYNLNTLTENKDNLDVEKSSCINHKVKKVDGVDLDKSNGIDGGQILIIGLETVLIIENHKNSILYKYIKDGRVALVIQRVMEHPMLNRHFDYDISDNKVIKIEGAHIQMCKDYNMIYFVNNYNHLKEWASFKKF